MTTTAEGMTHGCLRILASGLLGLGLATAPALAGGFALTGSMHTGRDDHSAALLGNGDVLVTGGENSGGAILARAELCDPATGT